MKFSLLFLLALILGGCALTDSHVSKPFLAKTPEMERGFRQAETLFYARRFSEAKAQYQGYLDRFPMNALTSKVYFRLGEIEFYEGERDASRYKQAVIYYKKALDRGIPPEWGGSAIYKQAVAYFRLGQPRKVFSLLNRLSSESDPKLALRAASLRVSTARKAVEPLEEIRGYLEAVDAHGAIAPSALSVGDLNWVVSEKKGREELSRWISDVTTRFGDLGPLQRWLIQLRGKDSGGYVTWKIAKLHYEKGDYRKASSWARDYLTSYPKHRYVAAARILIEELDKRGEGPAERAHEGTKDEGRTSVGVLLPLTGKYAVYGKSVLHGLECAAGVFGPCDGGGLSINLVIEDTQGSPKIAAQKLRDLARRSEIAAVIGPLPQSEVEATVAIAEEAGIPMIALSQKPNLAQGREYVFRNFLTVADQVSTLVDYACGEKRWKKFAILYPEAGAGEEYRSAFEEEVARCGGKVVAQSGYIAATRDFNDAVRSLKFSSPEQNIEEKAPFQALFIPAVYRQVPPILRALKFHQMEEVSLLGGAGWNHASLVAEEAEEVEGAVFVDGFFARGSEFATREFVAAFQASYGLEPTLLEAYAFDTLRMLGKILRDRPTLDRPDLQREISQVRNFQGVTGTISFDEEGDARRRLLLLTVKGGTIQEVK